MSKAGRKKSYTADYFPHKVEKTAELEFLENMFKEKGFQAYFRILELASKSYKHLVPYKTDYDIQTLRFHCNTDHEVVDKCIEYLVDRDFINQEMFAEGKIWIPYLIRQLSGLYNNRRHDPPQKVDKDIITTCRNTQLVSELPSELPSQVVSEKTTTDVDKVIDDFKDNNKDLDVDKSLTKLKNHNSNPTAQDITNWLTSDLAKGWNIKQPYKQFDNGNFRAYCSKCGSSDTLGGIQGTRGLTSCCGAEYQPEPMAKKAND